MGILMFVSCSLSYLVLPSEPYYPTIYEFPPNENLVSCNSSINRDHYGCIRIWRINLGKTVYGYNIIVELVPFAYTQRDHVL
ncbi:hypothetical protein F4774DRAFT_391624 [Daldinia eschscholtzii]|nr:hypothetical protein F4774DRAFT_391624 [Daldinia eschscholtzii]